MSEQSLSRICSGSSHPELAAEQSEMGSTNVSQRDYCQVTDIVYDDCIKVV